MALKGNQKKLDKNNNNRIDAQDFKILKAEKKGKVMKAKRGDFMERRKKLMGINSVRPKVSQGPKSGGRSALGRIGRAGLLGAVAGYGTAEIIKRVKGKLDERKARKRDEAKVKKMGGGMMKKYNKGGMSASEKFKHEVKAIKETIDDKNTPMKADRMLTGLKAAYKKAFPKKKMGGGMMKRPMGYTKGGGADTGTMGEAKSKLATGIDAFKRRLKKEKLQAPKRGPMKPLKAKKGRSISTRGGGVDSGTFGRIRDAGPFRPIPTTPPGGFKPMGPDRSERLKKLIERKNRKEKIKDVVRKGSQLLPGVGAIGLGKRVFEKFGGQKQEPREKGERPSRRGRMGQQRSKPDASRNPNPKTPKMMGAMGGGMMMKPMGYKSGTSVKAKCKLGRNKPTKMY